MAKVSVLCCYKLQLVGNYEYWSLHELASKKIATITDIDIFEAEN